MAVVISINAERRAGEVGFRISRSGAWKASRTNSKAPPTDIGLDDLPFGPFAVELRITILLISLVAVSPVTVVSLVTSTM